MVLGLQQETPPLLSSLITFQEREYFECKIISLYYLTFHSGVRRFTRILHSARPQPLFSNPYTPVRDYFTLNSSLDFFHYFTQYTCRLRSGKFRNSSSFTFPNLHSRTNQTNPFSFLQTHGDPPSFTLPRSSPQWLGLIHTGVNWVTSLRNSNVSYRTTNPSYSGFKPRSEVSTYRYIYRTLQLERLGVKKTFSHMFTIECLITIPDITNPTSRQPFLN